MGFDFNLDIVLEFIISREIYLLKFVRFHMIKIASFDRNK